MRHEIRLQCGRFLLRPVTLDDSGFICQLRTDPQIAKFIVNSSSTVEQQAEWIRRYFDRPGDYYFIIEHSESGEQHGTIAIYDLEPDAKTAEWGRWLIRSRSLCALPSAWMIHECAFRHLRLESLYSRTQQANAAVVSFHDNFGAKRTAVISDDPAYPGTVIKHSLNAGEWPPIRDRVIKLIARLSR